MRPVLKKAWADFLSASDAAHRAAYAVTLAYNPHRLGTARPCYRIAQDTGECERIPNSGIAAAYSINRIAWAKRIPAKQVDLDLDRLHGRVDRILFGSRFNLLPASERTAFVGFIERPDYNVHVHLTWCVPEVRAAKFATAISKAWRATNRVINPDVTSDVQLVRDSGWGRYIIKDQWGSALDDATLFVASRSARS